VPRPTTHNKGTTRSEAEGVLGESLAMADPDLAFYVECNEALRARHEALLERVAKLERAYEELLDLAMDMRSYVPEYFAEKWKHDEGLSAAREALDG
jgi:hypothetical protein